MLTEGTSHARIAPDGDLAANITPGADGLNPPHGGTLVDLIVPLERARELKVLSRDWPSWALTPRQLCDLELLLNGGFSPLDGFLSRADYEGVCQDMKLADGTLWPIPVVLDVNEETARRLEVGAMLALRDPEGVMLAALRVADVWRPDLADEAERVYGTSTLEHPGVAHLMRQTNPWYVGGRLEGLQPPVHHDFTQRRLAPGQVRQRLAAMGWSRTVAFQTRNPMHRAHQELTLRAAREADARLLIHPVVGMTKPGDVDHYTRVRCYEKIVRRYPPDTAMLSLLPLAMRMAGPREALLHAIIRKNYGCTHLIVGRDHAGPGSDSLGRPFYGPYEAQELLRRHEADVGITMVPFKMMVFVQDERRYVPVDEVADGASTKTLSGTQLREHLAEGTDIPAWFSFPEIVQELQRTYPPCCKRGFTVFFTGLPSSGKSTLANVLMVKLLEAGGRPVTLLDGDIVRKHLSSELGFSKEHRDINIRRIGFVASEITKNGGIAICAPIAPYDYVRKEVRKMISACGGFVLVHVMTPLDVCEQRDRKGLYAKARLGIVKEFTGISDPYEEPGDAEIRINTTAVPPEKCVRRILAYLEENDYVDLSGSVETMSG
jgi:sulfate adenylyltransferase